MSIYCPRCNHHNPPNARFCASCGRSLGRGHGCTATCGAGIPAVVIVGLIVWVGFGGGFAKLVRTGRSLLHREPVVMVGRDFDLDPAKADALFDLLKPRDVKVLVDRRGARAVHIEGTSGEAETLQAFVELLTRFDGHADQCTADAVKKLAPTWTARKTYKLSRNKARSLFRILAFDDVPVYVSGQGPNATVDATEADQKIIRGVVQILRGRR